MMRLAIAFVLGISAMCAGSMLPISVATPTAQPEQSATVPALPKTIAATATATVEPKRCVVTAEFLNVRSGPGSGFAIIGSLAAGDVVDIADTVSRQDSSDWYKISAGYINGLFCEQSQQATAEK